MTHGSVEELLELEVVDVVLGRVVVLELLDEPDDDEEDDVDDAGLDEVEVTEVADDVLPGCTEGVLLELLLVVVMSVVASCEELDGMSEVVVLIVSGVLVLALDSSRVL